MARSRWGATKFCIGYACVASLGSIITYAPTGWHHPRYPNLHVVVAIAVNLAGAVIVGMILDAVKHLLITRVRAAIAGALIAVPLFFLFYLAFVPESFTLKQYVMLVGIGVVVGAAFGSVAWLPDD